MTRKPVLLISLILLSGFIGCATVQVAVNYDEAVDFGNYHSFFFVRPRQNQMQGRGAVQNPLFTREVTNEIRPILEGKGFTEAASREEADMLIIFYANVQHRRDWVPPTYHVGRWGRVWRTSPGHPVHYKEGTLVIDIVDWNKKELIWQGIGTGVLDRTNPGENLVESVEEILERFPPQG